MQAIFHFCMWHTKKTSQYSTPQIRSGLDQAVCLGDNIRETGWSATEQCQLHDKRVHTSTLRTCGDFCIVEMGKVRRSHRHFFRYRRFTDADCWSHPSDNSQTFIDRAILLRTESNIYLYRYLVLCFIERPLLNQFDSLVFWYLG